MKAFYGAKISPHLTESPEGFLICLGVPICRTGTQKYLPSEIGEQGTDLIDVFRNEDEVFKPAAMASFEGKPVTDDHPPQEVTPDNYGAYVKGAVQNVRRGSGDDADFVMCDLVIYDATLIEKIQHGKREVSCGYDCKYVDNGDGTFTQADIIGNHVAIVDSGRAGRDVSIRDAQPDQMKGRDKMQGKKKSIWERMFGAFVKDAEPAEVLEAAKAVDEACSEEKTEDTRTCDGDVELIMKAIHELNEKVEAMKNDLSDHYEDDKEEGEELNEKISALDALEATITDRMSKDSDEEEVTVDPEKLNDEEPEEVKEDKEEAEVIESGDADPEAEEEEEVKIEAKDRALSLAMLRAIKPFVAAMPTEQRKMATDALNKAVKKAMDVKPTQPIAGGYGALLKRKKTSDAEIRANQRAFGENCRKRNPHVKK